MKIAVNTRFLLPDKLEGIGWFTCETLKRITRQHPEHHFFFLFDRPYSEAFIFSDNITPLVLSPPARHPLLWYWWFEQNVPAALKKTGAEAFLSTDGYLSLKARVPSALVIHDIAFEHYPEHVPPLVRKYYRHFTPRYARKADAIATVSQFSKDDLVQRYGLPADKVRVVYNGANEAYHPLPEADQAAVREQYAGGKPYFLYVGAIQPRKNVARLLQSYERFRQQQDSEVKLLIAGRDWGNVEIREVLQQMQYREDVVFMGHLSLDALPKVMGGALALVYVSLFEGFGIPVLEAMHSEVPVITADVSSMPEVAGEAGLLVDPLSVKAITEAMQQMYSDKALRETMIRKGRAQREKFSWNRTAEGLWRCVEGIL